MATPAFTKLLVEVSPTFFHQIPDPRAKRNPARIHGRKEGRWQVDRSPSAWRKWIQSRNNKGKLFQDLWFRGESRTRTHSHLESKRQLILYHSSPDPVQSTIDILLGVLQSWCPGYLGRHARWTTVQDHLSVPGLRQRIPHATSLPQDVRPEVNSPPYFIFRGCSFFKPVGCVLSNLPFALSELVLLLSRGMWGSTCSWRTGLGGNFTRRSNLCWTWPGLRKRWNRRRKRWGFFNRGVHFKKNVIGSSVFCVLLKLPRTIH